MNPPASPAPLVWGSMGLTHVGLVAVALTTLELRQAESGTARALVPVAVLVATTSIVLGFDALLPAFRGFTRFLVRWAFAETATLVGFVATFQTGEPLYIYACASFGLLAWAAAFPSAAGLRTGEPPAAGEG